MLRMKKTVPIACWPLNGYGSVPMTMETDYQLSGSSAQSLTGTCAQIDVEPVVSSAERALFS